MLDNEPMGGEPTGTDPVGKAAESTTDRHTRTTRRRSAASEPLENTAEPSVGGAEATQPEERPVRQRRKTVTAEQTAEEGVRGPEAEPAKKATRPRRRNATAESVQPGAAVPAAEVPPAPALGAEAGAEVRVEPAAGPSGGGFAMAPTVLFMAPEATAAPATPPKAAPPGKAAGPGGPSAERAEDEGGEPIEAGRRRRRARRTAEAAEAAAEPAEELTVTVEEAEAEDEDEDEDAAARRRRRRGRRGRGRGKGGLDEGDEGEETAEPAVAAEDEDGEPLTRRRRRRRRKGGGDEEPSVEDGVPTVVRIREPRKAVDEVQGVSGSTRLEAKRQRRRDGREQRRTRPPILSESEFLARREAVDRAMIVRQRGDRTQIAVLEDGVLVEHYVSRASSGTMAGNVYLGKVQNVLPSMEAAFVDVGRGRNAVLYAGEVNWDATGLEGRARSIEQALRSGDSVLVQVTKDPIGHKGARLTSHVALSGRHLVYVPHGNASGISRKLPDNERKRLRDILKKLVPDGAGVIVRTAAEGATEDELTRDVKRLQAQWEDIQAKAAEGGAPALLYEEPDLVIRVVRDLFNEDFRELVVQGDEAYDTVEAYLSHVSPDLVPRLRRHTGAVDVFAERRIDEQILKGLDRKVFLPSGGHLVIDRTEAMTVIDVNTGKYTGAGGNLEETVTRNNLEAAEEIVRQLRLRDIGGIVVIDFIDMVLESNRELVLRRLTECLGRDRTKHQVTEITSLGLVQMTRKRIGAGLLEAFSETCEVCKGRGLIIHTEPVPEKPKAVAAVKAVAAATGPASGGRRRGRKAASEPTEVVEVTAVEVDHEDTMGYDLSRYAIAEEATDATLGDAEVGEAEGADVLDVEDVADLEDVEDIEGEPAGGGAVGRRRSRRGGARRRTRA